MEVIQRRLCHDGETSGMSPMRKGPNKRKPARLCAGFKNISPDGFNDGGDEMMMRYHGASPSRKRSPNGRSA